MIAFESRGDAQGGSLERARTYFNRTMELSGGSGSRRWFPWRRTCRSRRRTSPSSRRCSTARSRSTATSTDGNAARQPAGAETGPPARGVGRVAVPGGEAMTRAPRLLSACFARARRGDGASAQAQDQARPRPRARGSADQGSAPGAQRAPLVRRHSGDRRQVEEGLGRPGSPHDLRRRRPGRRDRHRAQDARRAAADGRPDHRRTPDDFQGDERAEHPAALREL